MRNEIINFSSTASTWYPGKWKEISNNHLKNIQQSFQRKI